MSTGDFPELDKLLHNRVRLAVMVLLAEHGEMSHTELREALGVTDGNLATHIAKLEAEGLVEVEKGFSGRRPRTVYRITQRGRERLLRYAKALKEILGKLGGEP